MQRIQGAYATEDNRFTEGNPATGLPATVVSATWLNNIQEELCAVIETAGIDLDGEDQTQVLAAINTLITALTPDGAGGLYVGEHRLLPFGAAELPSGWYVLNGDLYADESPQGTILNGLPTAYKSAWGIVSSGGFVNLPDAFDASGAGYFWRPVDGSSRAAGSIETDAIRNIVGELALNISGTATGVFALASQATRAGGAEASGARITFDASSVVPTASENRPVNVGLTPAIYLGV